ncbi:hypothetical protein ANO14919_101700 [Xylariales sp. No.14919]|nr:hypothetical protein ANO14919_101700 [Xylariales sp. No.14919]
MKLVTSGQAIFACTINPNPHERWGGSDLQALADPGLHCKTPNPPPRIPAPTIPFHYTKDNLGSQSWERVCILGSSTVSTCSAA